MRGFNATEFETLTASLLPLETDIDVGPLLIDQQKQFPFRLVNKSSSDSGAFQVSIGGSHREWFRLAKFRRANQPLTSLTVANIPADRFNSRVGYLKRDEYRVKIFLPERSPSVITQALRLAPEFRYDDSLAVVLPPTGYLHRDWAAFSPEVKNPDGTIFEVSKWKRTCYLVKYQGSYYALENAIPIFSFNTQLCFYTAEAVRFQEAAGANAWQSLPFNCLYRYRSHRPIDMVQSVNPSPDEIDTAGSLAGSVGES